MEIESKKINNYIYIHVNKQNFIYETDNAVLVKMPNKSGYKDFTFWMPKKLIKQGQHSYDFVMIIGINFKIKAERKSEKTYKVLDSKEFTPDDIQNIFENKKED